MASLIPAHYHRYNYPKGLAPRSRKWLIISIVPKFIWPETIVICIELSMLYETTFVYLKYL